MPEGYHLHTDRRENLKSHSGRIPFLSPSNLTDYEAR
jgi:hypothetical protein